MNAIYILWLRQLKKYARSRSRIVASVGQPLLFLLAFGFGFGPIYQKAGEGSYIQFMAPGIIAMSILFMAMFTGIEIIWDRQFGFLKETLVAPVSRTNIMIGRTLGGATVALIQGLLIFCITLLVGFRPEHLGLLPLAFGFMALIAILFTAIGTAVACTMRDMQAFPLFMNFLMMPLFFLSGALFPLKDLPPVLALITRLDPLSYGVDGLRGALIGSPQFGFALDAAVLIILSVIVLWIGSRLFARIQI